MRVRSGRYLVGDMQAWCSSAVLSRSRKQCRDAFFWRGSSTAQRCRSFARMDTCSPWRGVSKSTALLFSRYLSASDDVRSMNSSVRILGMSRCIFIRNAIDSASSFFLTVYRECILAKNDCNPPEKHLSTQYRQYRWIRSEVIQCGIDSDEDSRCSISSRSDFKLQWYTSQALEQ